MLKGILAASGELRREGDADFQQAIQTTDAFEKRACLEVELSGGPGPPDARSARARG